VVLLVLFFLLDPLVSCLLHFFGFFIAPHESSSHTLSRICFLFLFLIDSYFLDSLNIEVSQHEGVRLVGYSLSPRVKLGEPDLVYLFV